MEGWGLADRGLDGGGGWMGGGDGAESGEGV